MAGLFLMLVPLSAAGRPAGASDDGRVRLEVELYEEGVSRKTRVLDLDLSAATESAADVRLGFWYGLAGAGLVLPVLVWLGRRPRPAFGSRW